MKILSRTPKGCEHPWLGTPALGRSIDFILLVHSCQGVFVKKTEGRNDTERSRELSKAETHSH